MLRILMNVLPTIKDNFDKMNKYDIIQKYIINLQDQKLKELSNKQLITIKKSFKNNDFEIYNILDLLGKYIATTLFLTNTYRLTESSSLFQ